jgi:hypothetical protein
VTSASGQEIQKSGLIWKRMTIMLGNSVFEYAGAMKSTCLFDLSFIAMRGEGVDDSSNSI